MIIYILVADIISVTYKCHVDYHVVIHILVTDMVSVIIWTTMLLCKELILKTIIPLTTLSGNLSCEILLRKTYLISIFPVVRAFLVSYSNLAFSTNLKKLTKMTI